MDGAIFLAWLSDIDRLSAWRRREALRILVERSGSLVPVADLAEVSAAFLPPPPAGAAPADDQVSRIGQARLGCPHCGGDAIGRWGRTNGKPRYRCATCARTFNPVTGTPLAGLHYPERWADQARALIAGETIARAARRCGVDYTNAFRWRHRVLAALNDDKPAQLYTDSQKTRNSTCESVLRRFQSSHDPPRLP